MEKIVKEEQIMAKSCMVNSFYSGYTEDYVSRWALISMLGIALFAVTVSIVYFTQSVSLSAEDFVMGFNISGQSKLLIFAGAGIFTGLYSLMKTVYLAYPFPTISCSSLFFLGIATVSVLTWFIPADSYTQVITFSGYVHRIGFFAGSVSSVMFIVIFTIRLRSSELIRGRYKILIYLALLAPVLFIISLITKNYSDGFHGFFHILCLGVVISWGLITANGIRVRAITYV